MATVAPGYDYQAAATAFNPTGDALAASQNLAQMRQIAAQHLAGQQIAGGNYQQGTNTLYGSGDIKDAQQEQQFGGTVAGATGLASNNFAGAKSGFASAGDVANVQGAQQAQMRNYQILGSYLQQASPVLKAAYAQNGTAGLTHAVGLTTQELVQAGLMTPAQSQQYVQQAGSDPQGLLSNVDNFVQQVSYQKVGDNGLLATDAFGRPVSMVSGPTQTALTTPGGGQTLVGVPGSVTPVVNGATGGASPTPSASPAPGATQQPVNNPGNLRVPGSTTAFQNFPTAQAGVQAVSAQLADYTKPVAQGGHGLSTLRQVIATYAPPSENDTNTYANNVSNWTGIDLDKPIDLSNPATNNLVTQAVIRQEQGSAAPVAPGSSQPPASQATPPASVLASTALNGSLYRLATPDELKGTPYVSAQVNTATGQMSNTVNTSDVNTLTPAATQQLADQYWLTGNLPNLGRGGAASSAMQAIQNAAQAKSAALGLSGSDDNLRHATVAAAQKTLETMVSQQTQLATAENNAIDNANQIRSLLPVAAAKYQLRTVNDISQAIKRYTNDPQLAALDTAYKDFTGDYSKVMFSNANGNGGAGGVGDREANTEHFSPDDPIPVALAKLNQAQIGMSYRTQEFGASIQRLNQIARTGVIPPSQSATPVSGNQAPSTQQASNAPAPSNVIMYNASGQRMQ